MECSMRMCWRSWGRAVKSQSHQTSTQSRRRCRRRHRETRRLLLTTANIWHSATVNAAPWSGSQHTRKHTHAHTQRHQFSKTDLSGCRQTQTIFPIPDTPAARHTVHLKLSVDTLERGFDWQHQPLSNSKTFSVQENWHMHSLSWQSAFTSGAHAHPGPWRPPRPLKLWPQYPSSAALSTLQI